MKKRNSRSKKGVEAIVVWVLLIGFTVAMTATVFFYEKNQAKSMAENVAYSNEAKIECNDVAINIGNCDGTLGCKVNVYNTGKRSIYGIVYRDKKSKSKEYSITLDKTNFPIKPGLGITPIIGNTNGWNFNEGLDVIPLISVNDKLYSCSSKIIHVPYDAIDPTKDNLCNCLSS